MAVRQIGQFVIERQIGAGGMGIVYAAIHEPTGRSVALKVLTPALTADLKLLKRFEREIDILKRLSHPNIVKYYGGGTQNQQRYYAMEFIDGGSLQDILQRKHRLGWEQTIQVGRQLCAALEHAHNAGIVHRDLKPANLFISRKGRLKLGDFGIARDTEATALTAAGKTVGTYAYMAPEQIQGNAPISGKTDLYATGCLLFECLTGETPFTAENPAEMLIQHLNDYPRNVREIVSDCPVWLDELIERLLQKKQEDRPHDALAVHTELAEIHRRMTQSQVTSAARTSSGTGTTGSADAADTAGVPKKKKKKKDRSQFYERWWFLSAVLALVIGVTVWMTLPPGETALYDLARAGWESGDQAFQRDAREKHMLPYLERFPDGKHAAEIRQWADQIQLDVLEAQAEKKARGNKEPRDSFEAAYITAWQVEQDRDRNPLEAIEMYHAMTEHLKDQPDAGYWVMLADRHLKNIRTALLESPDRDQRIRQRMRQAEMLQSEGKSAEARAIWYHFREAFYGFREVEAFNLYAVRRTNEEPYPIPDEVSGSR